MSKIDIEAELRALGEAIAEWCDSPEGRAQDQRLMARMFGEDRMTTQQIETRSPVITRERFDALVLDGWRPGEYGYHGQRLSRMIERDGAVAEAQVSWGRRASAMVRLHDVDGETPDYAMSGPFETVEAACEWALAEGLVLAIENRDRSARSRAETRALNEHTRRSQDPAHIASVSPFRGGHMDD